MVKKDSIETRLGSVAYTILEVRHSTMKAFFKDFEINYLSYCDNKGVDFKEVRLHPNFVYFLIENKTFIQFYNRDYYSDKSVKIISNISSLREEEIEKYFQKKNYKVSSKYPYRYMSSYAIDYKLNKKSDKYIFLSYNESHRYEGNFEYRRATYSN